MATLTGNNHLDRQASVEHWIGRHSLSDQPQGRAAEHSCNSVIICHMPKQSQSVPESQSVVENKCKQRPHYTEVICHVHMKAWQVSVRPGKVLPDVCSRFESEHQRPGRPHSKSQGCVTHTNEHKASKTQ